MLKKIWLNITSITVSLIILGLGIMGFVLFFFIRPSSQSMAYVAPKQLVDAFKLPQSSNHSAQLLLYARVKSTQHTALAAMIPGEINQLMVRDGHYVHKNEVLLTMDLTREHLDARFLKSKITELQTTAEQQQLKYQAALQDLDYQKKLLQLSEKALARKGALKIKGYSSTELLEQEQQKYFQQKIQVHNSEVAIDVDKQKISQLEQQIVQTRIRLKQVLLDISDGVVRSPFNGIVTHLHVATGEYVRQGEPLIEVLSTEDLEARALVPHKYLDFLLDKKNNLVPLHAQAVVHGRRISLRLQRIAGHVKLGQLGREAVFRIVRGSRFLAGGQRFKIIIDLPAIQHSYLLPINCLYGKNKIYIIKNSILHPYYVTLHGKQYMQGRSTKMVVTAKDLQQGLFVLRTQLPNAISGLQVTIKPQVAAQSL